MWQYCIAQACVCVCVCSKSCESKLAPKPLAGWLSDTHKIQPDGWVAAASTTNTLHLVSRIRPLPLSGHDGQPIPKLVGHLLHLLGHAT